MKPPASAIVDNLIWGTDGGVWAVWSAEPLPTAHQPLSEQVDVHSQLRGLFLALPERSMLLSVCEAVDPVDVTDRMGCGRGSQLWDETLEATKGLLADYGDLYRRRYYVAARIGSADPQGTADRIREAVADVSGWFGAKRRGPATVEIERHSREAMKVTARLSASRVRLTAVTPGQIRWLYARALRRGIGEPAWSDGWEPRFSRQGGVLAQLTDVRCQEGGSRDDQDRPRHRGYLRVVARNGQVGYQSAHAVADMPHEFTFPGGGECLYGSEQLPFPVDWCVRIRSVDNQTAKAKLKRQHRELIGQFDEYEGEVTGAPPELSKAVAGIEDMRDRLASSSNEPELWATVVFSIAANNLVDLEERSEALVGMFEPYEFGLGRPTGGQEDLIRAFLPGTDAPSVCDDYRQYLTAGDLAGLGPLTAATVGDPKGSLLGLSLDAGIPTPILFDPAYGPSINSSASLVACGALGSGKSYFLKRLVADTVARGDQVVTLDRTARREYVQLAQGLRGVECAVVELGADSTVSLDPLGCFAGEDRTSITLGFLSMLVGCRTQSEEGITLADAVYEVADRSPRSRLTDVVERLTVQGDPVASSLARQLSSCGRSGLGRLAFGEGRTSLPMDANFIVFSAPHLSLPDEKTLTNEHLARQMLPQQILGQALLYLISAVSRHIVFSDPSRFGAALFDEAAALLASPHGKQLVMEGITDGRKHNGAIWIASQHPNHFADPELLDLLGPRFVFRQDGQATRAAMTLLGSGANPEAEATLSSLGSGLCMYRDVRRRVGAIQVLPPALDYLEAAFDTRPTSAETPAAQAPASEPAPGDQGAWEHVRNTISQPDGPAGDEPTPWRVPDEWVTDPDPDPVDQALPVPVDLATVRARAWARRSNPLAGVLSGFAAAAEAEADQ